MSPREWEKHKVLYSEIFNDNRDNRDNFFSSEILLPRKNVVSIVSIVVKKRVGVICLV